MPAESNGYNLTMNKNTDKSVIVIGAGICGLLAATLLQRAGRDVLVIDKGRQVGGRMATRRIDGAVFDHGAQYFTAKDARFQSWVSQWQQDGLVEVWHHGEGNTGHPRYVCPKGMTSIARHLAESLQVQRGERVTELKQTGTSWSVYTDNNQSYSCEALVLTPPVPQSLALLGDEVNRLNNTDRTALESLRYARSLALLVSLPCASELPVPGYASPDNSVLAWIADNRLKGVSPRHALTLHATESYSLEAYDCEDDEIAQTMLDAATQYIPVQCSMESLMETSMVKRWRFAKPETRWHENSAEFSEIPRVWFAGDAFHSGRVEGAAISGLVVAERILSHFD